MSRLTRSNDCYTDPYVWSYECPRTGVRSLALVDNGRVQIVSEGETHSASEYSGLICDFRRKLAESVKALKSIKESDGAWRMSGLIYNQKAGDGSKPWLDSLEGCSIIHPMAVGLTGEKLRIFPIKMEIAPGGELPWRPIGRVTTKMSETADSRTDFRGITLRPAQAALANAYKFLDYGVKCNGAETLSLKYKWPAGKGASGNQQKSVLEIAIALKWDRWEADKLTNDQRTADLILAGAGGDIEALRSDPSSAGVRGGFETVKNLIRHFSERRA